MKLNEEIDGGDILITQDITYDVNNTSMREFVDICDDATVKMVKQHFKGRYRQRKNKSWEVKVAKGTDSKKVVDILKNCLEKKVNIYLPPRAPHHSQIYSSWDLSFVEKFKKANDFPYPSHYESEE